MYTNKDIEEFLVKARKEKVFVADVIDNVSVGMDNVTLKNILADSDFVAEDFNRYDSDLCEQFLTVMEQVGIAKPKNN